MFKENMENSENEWFYGKVNKKEIDRLYKFEDKVLLLGFSNIEDMIEKYLKLKKKTELLIKLIEECGLGKPKDTKKD